MQIVLCILKYTSKGSGQQTLLGSHLLTLEILWFLKVSLTSSILFFTKGQAKSIKTEKNKLCYKNHTFKNTKTKDGSEK